VVEEGGGGERLDPGRYVALVVLESDRLVHAGLGGGPHGGVQKKLVEDAENMYAVRRDTGRRPRG
jgi:hypothetical protein